MKTIKQLIVELNDKDIFRRSSANMFAVFVCIVAFGQIVDAKEHKTAGAKIEISAPAQIVFEAIRKQRNSNEQHRKLVSFDGKVAVIDEKMEHVPIYGNVDCTFEETEYPYKRIDYKMVKSTKFKESFGTWLLTPSVDGKATTLEFDSFTDSGLLIPFGGEITKMESVKTAKLRLQHIKEVSESMAKDSAGKETSKDASKDGSK